MGEANKAKPVSRIHKASGKVLETYTSRQQAAKHFGSNPITTYGSITDVLTGRQKSAYGFKWAYAKEKEIQKE